MPCHVDKMSCKIYLSEFTEKIFSSLLFESTAKARQSTPFFLLSLSWFNDEWNELKLPSMYKTQIIQGSKIFVTIR